VAAGLLAGDLTAALEALLEVEHGEKHEARGARRKEAGLGAGGHALAAPSGGQT
jgi:hypothetical protein